MGKEQRDAAPIECVVMCELLRGYTMETFTAITYNQHPLTGEAMPATKKISRDTTVGDLIDWIRKGKDFNIGDLRIVQDT